MRASWLTALAAAIFGVLPILTVLAWPAYHLFIKRVSGWGDQSGLIAIMFLPSLLAIGLVPQVLTMIWLVSRYGPRLELLSPVKRFFAEALPMALWVVTTIVSILCFFYVRNGKI